MESAIYIGGFLIVWGLLYWVFAFVGKDSGLARSLFKVPAIFVFLPERMILSVGRILTGILCIGAGTGFIWYMLNQLAV